MLRLWKVATNILRKYRVARAIKKIESSIEAGDKTALLKSNRRLVQLCNHDDKNLAAHWTGLAEKVGAKEGLGLNAADEMGTWTYYHAYRDTSLGTAAKEVCVSVVLAKMKRAVTTGDEAGLVEGNRSFVRFCGENNKTHVAMWKDLAYRVVKTKGLDFADKIAEHICDNIYYDSSLNRAAQEIRGSILITRFDTAVAQMEKGLDDKNIWEFGTGYQVFIGMCDPRYEGDCAIWGKAMSRAKTTFAPEIVSAILTDMCVKMRTGSPLWLMNAIMLGEQAKVLPPQRPAFAWFGRGDQPVSTPERVA